MNKKVLTTRKSFQYDHNKKKSTIVVFDIVEESGKKVARNLTLTSNFRTYYPHNSRISFINGVYCFSGDGTTITNGDIQQIIKRILSMLDDIKE